jgi:hypothetical protein
MLDPNHQLEEQVPDALLLNLFHPESLDGLNSMDNHLHVLHENKSEHPIHDFSRTASVV